MSKLERGFITTADKVYKKVEGKDGKTYRFKDGTPITQESYSAAQQHIKQEGLNVNVAVSSKKGPGYERKSVSQQEASSLGKNLSILRTQRDADRDTGLVTDRDTFEIDGEQYTLDELYGLNQRIVQRHGADTVFRYK